MLNISTLMGQWASEVYEPHTSNVNGDSMYVEHVDIFNIHPDVR